MSRSTGASLERSGYFVSITAGVLTVLCAFGWARRLYGDRIGLLAGSFAAISPYAVRSSVEIKSDALYTLLFVATAWVGYRAFERRSLPWGIAAGIGTALAYYCRPEGVGLLVVLAVWFFIGRREEWSARPIRKAALVVAPALVWLVLASPYLIFLKSDQGGIAITQKKDLRKLLTMERMDARDLQWQDVGGGVPKSLETEPGSSEVDRGFRIHVPYLAEADYLFARLISGYNEFFGLLLLVAFFAPGRGGPPWRWVAIRRDRVPPWGKADLFVASFLGVYLPSFYALTVAQGTVSRRYLVSLSILALPWAAIGFLHVSRFIASRIAARTPLSLERAAFGTAAVLILFLSLAMGAKGMKSRGKHE
ncbi:MAG: glycosyltransferase family 39 protein, partial [Vicinamibacteria bacterium]